MKLKISLKFAAWILINSLTMQYAIADSAKAQVFVEKAQQKLARGEVSSAELFYAQAMQEDPNNSNISLAVADLMVQQRRYEEADQLIEKSDINNYRRWKSKGMLYQSKGDQPHTVEAYEKALTLGGGKEDAYLLNYLQMYYESNGNTARQQQMENLLGSLALRPKK